jgi:hypothetical protein
LLRRPCREVKRENQRRYARRLRQGVGLYRVQLNNLTDAAMTRWRAHFEGLLEQQKAFILEVIAVWTIDERSRLIVLAWFLERFREYQARSGLVRAQCQRKMSRLTPK